MNDAELAALLDLDRTKLPPDGGERFNRLIFARSPYLLQHADNPTDWREWGEDAFVEARMRGVPLFVSIGYATCHWCHVMAHESFADREVAQELNQGFVPVKVDREERPDLDEFYMAASQALTGTGGWPLNVFIGHDRRPFFAFTYLPKHAGRGMSGFVELLRNISTAWKERRDSVERNCSSIMESLAGRTSIKVAGPGDTASHAAAAYSQLSHLFEPRHGGFGTSPKFPMPTYLLFLLSRVGATAPHSREMAKQTLLSMARGGINDQLGGGFHRYSVDERWLVPHFEKMLYDQAMLIMAYAEGYRITGESELLATAHSTARFVVDELAIPQGGFCGALDADSEGEEGRFYVWSSDDIERTLGERAEPCLTYWGISKGGNYEGHTILHVAVEPAPFAASRGMTMEELYQTVEISRKLLLEARKERERPLRDLKVISAWNGLMIAALSRLAAVSGDKEWLIAAERSADFLFSNLMDPKGRLLRNWLRGPAPVKAFAEDYAYLCWGLLELDENGGDRLWLEKAADLAREMVRLFLSGDGRLTTCGIDTEQLPIELPSCQDGVLPSPAGVAASVLMRLSRLKDEPFFTKAAHSIINAYHSEIERSPAACLWLIMTEEELERVGPGVDHA